MARANVEAELDGARAWAGRHGWALDWGPGDLLLRAATYHRPVHRLLEVVAAVDGYRGEPPAWRVVELGTLTPTVDRFPSAAPNSIFHAHKVICAPWNRCAYKEYDANGPHDNWGGPSGWLQVTEGTRATTIAEMLAMIDVHLRQSPGYMS